MAIEREVEQLPLGVEPTDIRFGEGTYLYRAPRNGRQGWSRLRVHGTVWMKPYEEYPQVRSDKTPNDVEVYGQIVGCLNPRDEPLKDGPALFGYVQKEG